MNDKYVRISLLLISLLGIAIALPGALGLYHQRADDSFLKEVWGGWGNGPCVIGGKCGNVGGGKGTCGGEPCSGNCIPYCALGGNHKFCMSESGNCTISDVHCSRIETRTCYTEATGCECNPTGWGGWCSQQDC